MHACIHTYTHTHIIYIRMRGCIHTYVYRQTASQTGRQAGRENGQKYIRTNEAVRMHAHTCVHPDICMYAGQHAEGTGHSQVHVNDICI